MLKLGLTLTPTLENENENRVKQVLKHKYDLQTDGPAMYDLQTELLVIDRLLKELKED